MFKKVAEFFDITEKQAKFVVLGAPFYTAIGFGLLWIVAFLSPGI